MTGSRTPRQVALRAGLLLGFVVAAFGVASAPASAATGSTRIASITASPASGLLDGTPVQVTGSGLPPGEQAYIAQCAGEAASTCAQVDVVALIIPPNVAIVTVQADGTFSARLRISRGIPADGGGATACVAPGCRIQIGVLAEGEFLAHTLIDVGQEGVHQWPVAPLDLDPPPGGLVDGWRVPATASGLSPWEGRLGRVFGPVAFVEVCRQDEELDPDQDCQVGTLDDVISGVPVDFATVQGDGTVDDDIAVDRHLDLPDGPYDCAVGGCTVALSQAGGNPRTERVPVTWAPEWAPWSSGQAFLSAAYAGIVGRPPTSTEVARLVPQMTDRSLTAVEVLLLLTDEADATIGEVARQYVAFFGRRPDTPGLRFWVPRMRSGASTASSLFRSFGVTGEFRATYAGLSRGQVVDRAYQRTLGRAADAAGRAYWIDRLDRGLAVSSFIGLVSRSAEFRRREADHAAVTALTYGIGGQLAPTSEQWGRAPRVVARDLIAAATPSS